MRDQRKGRKLHRVRRQRQALLATLASSIVLQEKIKTTHAKAKEVRTYLEPLITKASVGTLANRRFIEGKLSSEAARKLYSEVGPKFKEKKGGYVRIIKIGKRKGDAAPMVYIELTVS